MGRGSNAETEENEYGFAAGAANPSAQMQQAYWAEFQRQQ